MLSGIISQLSGVLPSSYPSKQTKDAQLTKKVSKAIEIATPFSLDENDKENQNINQKHEPFHSKSTLVKGTRGHRSYHADSPLQSPHTGVYGANAPPRVQPESMISRSVTDPTNTMAFHLSKSDSDQHLGPDDVQSLCVELPTDAYSIDSIPIVHPSTPDIKTTTSKKSRPVGSPVRLLHLGNVDYSLSTHPVEPTCSACSPTDSDLSDYEMDCVDDTFYEPDSKTTRDTAGEYNPHDIITTSSNDFKRYLCQLYDEPMHTNGDDDDDNGYVPTIPVQSYVYGRSLSPASSMNLNETLCGANGSVSSTTPMVHLTYVSTIDHVDVHSASHPCQASKTTASSLSSSKPKREAAASHKTIASRSQTTKSHVQERTISTLAIEDVDQSTTSFFRQRFPHLYIIRRYEQQLKLLDFKSQHHIPTLPQDRKRLKKLSALLNKRESVTTVDGALPSTSNRYGEDRHPRHKRMCTRTATSSIRPSMTTLPPPEWPLVPRVQSKCELSIKSNSGQAGNHSNHPHYEDNDGENDDGFMEIQIIPNPHYMAKTKNNNNGKTAPSISQKEYFSIDLTAPVNRNINPRRIISFQEFLIDRKKQFEEYEEKLPQLLAKLQKENTPSSKADSMSMKSSQSLRIRTRRRCEMATETAETTEEVTEEGKIPQCISLSTKQDISLQTTLYRGHVGSATHNAVRHVQFTSSSASQLPHNIAHGLSHTASKTLLSPKRQRCGTPNPQDSPIVRLQCDAPQQAAGTCPLSPSPTTTILVDKQNHCKERKYLTMRKKKRTMEEAEISPVRPKANRSSKRRPSKRARLANVSSKSL